MPKLTVAQAINNLVEASKPAPTEVVIAEPKLKSLGQLIRYWLSVGLIFQIRTFVVWLFIATFFPQFGITWLAVMFGLYVIRHLVPTNLKQVIKAVAK